MEEAAKKAAIMQVESFILRAARIWIGRMCLILRGILELLVQLLRIQRRLELKEITLDI